MTSGDLESQRKTRTKLEDETSKLHDGEYRFGVEVWLVRRVETRDEQVGSLLKFSGYGGWLFLRAGVVGDDDAQGGGCRSAAKAAQPVFV